MNAELLEPWRPSPGDWDRAAVQHLFRRAGFGARPAELELALSTGVEATLERLFESRGAPELRGAVAPLLAAGDLELLQAWWMGLILEGGAPLRERLTLVWHDHFATSNDKVDDVRLMHAQNELFRNLGLGDFRALLRVVARDPAMLLWLDGDSNRRGHPNENFAREVLELFSLGIGNYTETDVREAARAFTGWGTSGRAFVFRAEQHDGAQKTLFGRTAPFDGDEALDWILAQPACARHLARTLLEAFVVPQPEDSWVADVARTLCEHDWNVGRTLRVLLGSRLFFAPEVRRGRIAGPVELVAVAARTSGARVAPLRAARMCAEMGQALFRPPSVKGWDGGYVVPLRALIYLIWAVIFVFAISRVLVGRQRGAEPSVSIRAASLAYPLVILLAAGSVPWLGGLTPRGASRGAFFIQHYFVAPVGGLETLRMFQPAWEIQHNPDHVVQYRPLKFLLISLAEHVRLGGVGGGTWALFGGHVAVGSLIVLLLLRWGVPRWAATMIGVGFTLHPITVSGLVIDQINYVWGTLALMGSLVMFQGWLIRPGGSRFALSLALYGASTLFVESCLGGAAILMALLLAERNVLSSAPTRKLSVWTAAFWICGVAALFTSLQLYVLLAYPSRLDIVTTAMNPRRVLLNLFFEPYWAFFLPFHAQPSAAQLLAVSSLVLVPTIGIIRRSSLGPVLCALWIATGLSLGAALTFFEMTPDWSSMRIAYEPCAVLSLCLGLLIAESTPRWANIWSTSCCLSLIILCLIERVGAFPLS